MAIYDLGDVSFMYPDNWAISVQEPNNELVSTWEVSLESPDGAIWVLHMIEKSEATSPHELLKVISDSLSQQYEDFEITAEQQTTVEDARVFTREADFFCLDFVVSARLEAIESTGRWNFCILCQAETREFDKVNEVFRAMTVSLLRKSAD